jgi:hypothetical protein
MWTALERPEFVHVLLNHFPITGLFIAVLFLGAAVLLNNRTAIFLGLGMTILTALSAWPVHWSGESAFDRVLSMSDEAGGAWLKHHAQLADEWIWIYYVTAAVGVGAMVAGWKRPALLRRASLAVLVVALASLAAGAVIADCGGKIRHREFRFSPPPAEKATDQPGR